MVEMDEVLVMAKKYAPSVIRKFNLPTNKFSPDDVVGEFLVNFMQKDFAAKFNPEVTSLNHYVYMGLRNAAVSMVRHMKYETTSLDEISENGPLPAPAEVTDFLLQEVLHIIEDTYFGYDKTVLVDGEVYESSAASVVKLMYKGYTKKEVAVFFGVTQGTISNTLRRVSEVVKRSDIV